MIDSFLRKYTLRHFGFKHSNMCNLLYTGIHTCARTRARVYTHTHRRAGREAERMGERGWSREGKEREMWEESGTKC